jgi:hypothetical protein
MDEEGWSTRKTVAEKGDFVPGGKAAPKQRRKPAGALIAHVRVRAKFGRATRASTRTAPLQPLLVAQTQQERSDALQA